MSRASLRTLLLAITVVVIGTLGFVTLTGREAQESSDRVVQRGEYLVKIMRQRASERASSSRHAVSTWRASPAA